MKAAALPSHGGEGLLAHLRAMLVGDKPKAKPLADHPAGLKDLDTIGKYLKYHAYDPETGLFINTDSIGFVLEVQPQTGADDAMEARLSTIFSVLPPDTCFQWTMFADVMDAQRAEEYVDLRRMSVDSGKSGQFFLSMAEKRAEFFQQSKGKPLFPGTNYSIKNMRLALSITRNPHRVDAAATEEMVRIKKALLTTLTTSNLACTAMDAESFIDFLKPMTDPRLMFAYAQRRVTKYDEGKSIGAQVGTTGVPLTVDADGRGLTWGFEDDASQAQIHATTFCVDHYPSRIELWQMGDVIGDFLDDNLQYPGPFVITMGGRTLDDSGVTEQNNYKTVRSEQARGSKLALVQGDIAKVAADTKFMADFLSAGGSQVDLYHLVTVFTEESARVGLDQTVNNIWKKAGMETSAPQGIQLPLYIACMPMTLTNDACDGLRDAKVMTKKTDQNAISMSPVLAEWPGTSGPPVLWYHGRRGTPTMVDLYRNPEGNYNLYVSGTAGAGKTVILNDLLVNYASVGASIRIVDSKRGFENLIKMCGGTYLRFDRDNMPCINPFTFIRQDSANSLEDEMAILKPLVARMASPNASLSALQSAFLERAITSAYAKAGPEAEPDLVAQELRLIKDERNQPERIAYELAEQLFPFTREGQYGRIVNGKATLNFHDQVVGIELEDLMNQPDLKRVVLFSVTARSLQEMYTLPRDLKKIFAIDEGWQHMDVNDTDTDSARFLEYGFRLARSYEGVFVIATQGIDDALKTKAGQAVFACSDWKFIGRQSSEALDALVQEGRMPYSAGVVKLIKSLSKNDRYSEWLIKSPSGSSVVRFIADPWFLTMSHSRGPVFQHVQSLIQGGMSTAEAITRVTDLRVHHG
jgi:conjugal transfer ATP-binding protein TraC